MYIYIYIYMYMAFTTAGFFEVAIAGMSSTHPQSQLCTATPISSFV